MNGKSFHVYATAVFLLILSGLIGGCSLISVDVLKNPTPVFSATNTIQPSSTPAPTATSTPQPTATPTTTSSPTPTPHPMSIQALRDMSYPGSEIVIETELSAGSNYHRYYAYYYSEGLKIYGLLTIPYADPPEDGFPAIVFNHGYIPPEIYRTTERYIAYVDWLTRSGYVVFRIDYRGHDQSEGEALGAYGDPGYVVDVLNAFSSLQQFPPVNPEKIGMWGHSLGGYLTLRAMVVNPEIKAGVIWAGVVASYPDLISKWRRPNSQPNPTPPPSRSWRQAWSDTNGTPEENPQFWASISSNTFVNEISGPLQLHHGTADTDVPLEFSQILFNEINAVNGVVEFYTYEGDNHNLSNYFSLAMTRSIEFFDRYLKE